MNKCYWTFGLRVDKRILSQSLNFMLKFRCKQSIDCLIVEIVTSPITLSSRLVRTDGYKWWQRWDRYYTLTTVEKETF